MAKKEELEELASALGIPKSVKEGLDKMAEIAVLQERASKALYTLGRTQKEVIAEIRKLTLDDANYVAVLEEHAKNFLINKAVLSSAKNKKVTILNNHLLIMQERIRNEVLPLAGFLKLNIVDPKLFQSLEDLITNIEEYFNKL